MYQEEKPCRQREIVTHTDAETIQHYRRREPLAHNRHLIICDGELVDIWSQIQCDYRAEKCREGCESKRIGQIPEALKTFQGVWWRRGKRSSSIKLAKSTLLSYVSSKTIQT